MKKSIVIISILFLIILIGGISLAYNYEADAIGTFIADTKAITYKININNGNNGSYSIFKEIYKEDNSFLAEKDETFNIIFIPDSGYAIDTVYVNGNDVTNSVKSGFLKIEKLNEDIFVDAIYKNVEEDYENKFTVKGVIKLNDKPLENAYLELHGDSGNTYIKYTDKKGNFEFKNVEEGKHSLTIMNDGQVLGYMEFMLKKDKISEYTINLDNRADISIEEGSTTIDIELGVKEDQTVEIEDIEYNNPKTGDTIFIFIVILIISLLFIIFFIIKIINNKNKGKGCDAQNK